MKFIIIFSFLAIISHQAVSQYISVTKIEPIGIPGLDKFKSGDKGTREFEVEFSIDKRLFSRSRDCIIELQLDGAGAPLSRPMLVESEILIKAIAISRYNKSKITRKIIVQLTPRECMIEEEQFKLTLVEKKSGTKLKEQTIKISPFTIIPDNVTAKLNIDSTIVVPLLSNDSSENGMRVVPVNIILSGKNQPPNDVSVEFSIPSYFQSPSEPRILNPQSKPIPKARFHKDSCPVRMQIPLVIQLKPTDTITREQRIPIIIKGDESTAHWLIIRPEATLKISRTLPKEQPKKDTGFNLTCTQGNNFLITFKRDSPHIAIIVKYLRTNVTASYRYTTQFNTFDFARWLTSVFKLADVRDRCNDCSLCASYVAERINGELAIQKPSLQEIKKELSASTASAGKPDSTKASTDTAKKSDSTPSVKPSIPDTIKYNSLIRYNDTMLFSLDIKRMKSRTEIQLCPEPKKAKDSCKSSPYQDDISREDFDKYIIQELRRFTGEKTIEQKNISPSLAETFDKYKKKLDENIPKDKSEAQKALDALGGDEYVEAKVGVVYLKDSTIDIYDDQDRLLKKTKIDSVEFVIESGRLAKRLLIVTTKDGMFTNKKTTIPVGRINDRGGDMLWNVTYGEKNFIRLKDVLRYKDIGGYYPDDNDSIVLVPKTKPNKVLTAAANLNSLINFTIFTDLAGLVGRKANGLINTDVSGKFITNTKNIRNVDGTGLSYVEANIVLSKFDSKFKSIDSSNVKEGANQKDTIDRMRIMEVAWLKGSIKFNLLSFRISRNQYINIDAGARINITNADSFYTTQTDIIFFEYWPEANYSIHRLRNFGMDIKIRWLFQLLSDRERFVNKGLEHIFNPGVTFFYYPTRKVNNKVYLRFNYFANNNDDAMNFYQLQFGWQSSLNLGGK